MNITLILKLLNNNMIMRNTEITSRSKFALVLNAMKPTTKTEQARAAFARSDYKAAFAIFKGFNLVFTKPEIRTLGIAYESLTGKSGFYQAMGIDTDQIIKEAKELILNKYLK